MTLEIDHENANEVGRALGPALRSLRISKGWSLDEVSARIKFSVRQLEALEAERWAELPTGVSRRGMVRGYARFLGADDIHIATLLGMETDMSATTRSALRPPQSLRHNVTTDEERASKPWGWLLVILALLGAGVGYACWQGWLPSLWFLSPRF